MRKSGRIFGVAIVVVLIGLTTISGCDSYDSDFIPYGLKGLDVWVYSDLTYDNTTEKEYYGGRVEASYFSNSSAISECGDLAYGTANHYHLQDWSYVCCTVTSSSDCVTKVR